MSDPEPKREYPPMNRQATTAGLLRHNAWTSMGNVTHHQAARIASERLGQKEVVVYTRDEDNPEVVFEHKVVVGAVYSVKTKYEEALTGSDGSE